MVAFSIQQKTLLLIPKVLNSESNSQLYNWQELDSTVVADTKGTKF